MNKVSRFKLLLFEIDIFLLIITFFMNADSISINLLSWIILILSIYFILTLFIKDNKIITPVILFSMMFSICMYGQPICKYIIGFETDKMIMNLFTEKEIFDAIKLSLQCQIMLHLGTIIPNKRINKFIEFDKYENIRLNSLKLTGIILLIISIIPAIYIYLTKIQQMSLGGYHEIFESKEVGISSIISKISMYFTLAIFILTVSYKNVKILIIGTIYVGSQMFFGARGIPMLTVVCLLLAYNYGVKKISNRALLIIIIGFILATNLMTVIGLLRKYPLSVWANNFDNVALYISQSNTLYEVIIELGAAIAPTAYAINIVPNLLSLKFGTTYLCALSLAVPDILGIRSPSVIKTAQIDQLVSSYAGIPFGGSLVEEAYVNFMYFAPLVFLVLGYIISKFSLKYINSKSPVFIATSSYMMVYILWTIRNVSNDFFQNSMYYVGLPLILYKLIEIFNMSKKGSNL